jgi:hypothetical protein
MLLHFYIYHSRQGTERKGLYDESVAYGKLCQLNKWQIGIGFSWPSASVAVVSCWYNLLICFHFSSQPGHSDRLMAMCKWENIPCTFPFPLGTLGSCRILFRFLLSSLYFKLIRKRSAKWMTRVDCLKGGRQVGRKMGHCYVIIWCFCIHHRRFPNEKRSVKWYA